MMRAKSAIQAAPEQTRGIVTKDAKDTRKKSTPDDFVGASAATRHQIDAFHSVRT
jgi:hypothetical protein